jgi:hypothetical protein
MANKIRTYKYLLSYKYNIIDPNSNKETSIWEVDADNDALFYIAAFGSEGSMTLGIEFLIKDTTDLELLGSVIRDRIREENLRYIDCDNEINDDERKDIHKTYDFIMNNDLDSVVIKAFSRFEGEFYIDLDEVIGDGTINNSGNFGNIGNLN